VWQLCNYLSICRWPSSTATEGYLNDVGLLIESPGSCKELQKEQLQQLLLLQLWRHDPRSPVCLPCRMFLTVHKGFGRAAAWQFWFMLGRAALPQQSDPMGYDEDSAGEEVTADLLLSTFNSTWTVLQARHQPRRDKHHASKAAIIVPGTRPGARSAW
jgi:hypothetical protein